MSIKKPTVIFLDEFLEARNLSYSDIRMLELGSQALRFIPDNYEQCISGKEFFLEVKGVREHVSIDINGKHGSIPQDLTEDLSNIDYWKPYKGYFNIVTNFGTSEHVSDQTPCFKNIDYLCLRDGFMIHGVPRKGCWMIPSHRHCHKYDLDFFERLATEYNYDIVINEVIERKKGKHKLDTVYSVLRKR